MQKYALQILILTLAANACSRPHPPHYEYPEVVYPTVGLTQILPQQEMVLLFDRAMAAPSPGAVHLVPFRDAGPCTPACPGTCTGKRCWVSQVDEQFLRDASAGDLAASREKLTLPVTLSLSGNRLNVSCAYGSLTPGSAYDVILTPRLQDLKGLPLVNGQGIPEAFPITYTTSEYARPEPQVALIFPTKGSKKFPLNATWLIVASDVHLGPLEALSFILYAPGEDPVPLIPERADVCRGEGADCLILRVGATLQPTVSYALKSTAQVTTPSGLLLPPWFETPWFTTGEVEWAWPLTMDGFTTESLTGCLHLAWEASGEALCHVLYEGGEKGPWFFAQRGPWEMALPSPRRFRVAAQGLDGSVTLGPWVELPDGVLTPPSVAITEIYANPVGKEPAQEYIELMNVSTLPVELEGYRLTDTLDATGDILPPYLLEAGERVVVVGSTWQAGSDDPEPASEEALIWLQNSLVNAGISNSGEPLYLFSPDGKLESRYLGWRLFTGNEGLSAERNDPLACDVDGNWRLVAPTPGE